MFQLYESELRCQKQKACAQKLFHQSVLFIYNRLDPWSSALYFWSSVHVSRSPQTQRLLMPACRELRSWPFHIVCPLLWTAQLQHPARSWKNRHSYDHYHSGILCFPYCLDLHHFCLRFRHSGIIPSVSLLMDHHIYRRNHLFHNNLQEAVIL